MKNILKIAAFALLFLYSVSCAPPQHTRRWMYSGSQKRRNIMYTANSYIGTRYKWGGTTPSGFDCSGFVMYVYRKNGINMPRVLMSQYNKGRKVSSRQLKPGDLVFFKTSSKGLSHVGIYSGKGKFIHAPRTGKTVRYSSISNPYWRKRYRGGVTYFR